MWEAPTAVVDKIEQCLTIILADDKSLFMVFFCNYRVWIPEGLRKPSNQESSDLDILSDLNAEAIGKGGTLDLKSNFVAIGDGFIMLVWKQQQ